MSYENNSHKSLLALCSTSIALGVLGFGCGDGGNSGAGGSAGMDGGVVQGCVAQVPPAEEPDLLLPPLFAEEIVIPGTTVEGDVGVDGETRTVIVELATYWDLEKPASGMETMRTGGNQTLTFGFPTGDIFRGRYFFRITLCGDDCALRRVLFTLAPDPDNPNLRSRYYQRIVFEGNTEVRSDATCLDADSVVVQ